MFLNALFETTFFPNIPITYLVGLRTASAIRKVVVNWSGKNTNCCVHLLYRIGQLFLSIFGKSDMQIARKYILKCIFRDPEEVSDELVKIIDIAAVKYLEFLIKINRDYL